MTTSPTVKKTTTKKKSSAVKITGRKSGPLSREDKIRQLAYSFAQEHNFASDPVLDWLAAEQAIDATKPKRLLKTPE